MRFHLHQILENFIIHLNKLYVCENVIPFYDIWQHEAEHNPTRQLGHQ